MRAEGRGGGGRVNLRTGREIRSSSSYNSYYENSPSAIVAEGGGRKFRKEVCTMYIVYKVEDGEKKVITKFPKEEQAVEYRFKLQFMQPCNTYIIESPTADGEE